MVGEAGTVGTEVTEGRGVGLSAGVDVHAASASPTSATATMRLFMGRWSSDGAVTPSARGHQYGPIHHGTIHPNRAAI
jgi:hypothetical protein